MFYGLWTTWHQDYGDRLFIVLELCSQGALSSHIFTKKKLDRARKLSWAAEIACGLVFLHGRSPPVAHRDLKPENVLLTSDFTCKLADFGTARDLLSDTKSITGNVGTVAYLPPEAMAERVDGAAQLGGAWDVYSCAVLICAVWTQSRPFGYLGHQDIYTAVSKQDKRPDIRVLPKKIDSINRNNEATKLLESVSDLTMQQVDDQLYELVETMWTREPRRRPSARIVLERLRQLLVCVEI